MIENKKPYPFASRTDWPLSANPITQLLDELRGQKAELFDLTLSNPTLCGFEYPSKMLLESLSNPGNLNYDPSPKGSLEARKAISVYYQKKNLTVSPDQIFLTSSTSEGYSFLFRLLVNHGERVLFPKPSYPLFQYFVDLNDIQVEYYPLTYEKEHWAINYSKLKTEFAADDARVIVLVNPNNPTGSYIQHAELDLLNDLCKRQQTAIISDEVFSDFNFEKQHASNSLIGNTEVLTFVLGGLSKTLALPQMKLSWIIIQGPPEQVEEASDRLEVIADTYLSVNTPAQNAVKQWLENKDLIQDSIKTRLKSNLEYLKRKVKEGQCVRLLAPEGGWYAILKVETQLSEDQFVLQLLKKEHVFVHPGFFFDFEDEGYLVISLLPEVDIFQEGIDRIIRMAETKNHSS